MWTTRTWGLVMAVFAITIFATGAEESEKEDPLGAMITTFIKRWHPQKVEHANELRRMVRAAGRHVRDLSDFMYPMAATASVFGQMMSFVPHIVDGAVTSIALLVDVFGRSLSVLGGGLEMSATAVEKTGRSIQSLSEAMPTVVTAVSVTGLGLILMFPGIQAWLTSAMASAGLMLASKMAAGARSYVETDSMWATLLESFELFTERARESFE